MSSSVRSRHRMVTVQPLLSHCWPRYHPVEEQPPPYQLIDGGSGPLSHCWPRYRPVEEQPPPYQLTDGGSGPLGSKNPLKQALSSK